MSNTNPVGLLPRDIFLLPFFLDLTQADRPIIQYYVQLQTEASRTYQSEAVVYYGTDC